MGKNQFLDSPKIRLIRALNPEPPTTDATYNYYFSAPKSGFGVTLIVPVGSAEKYKAKVEWQNFTIIESTFEVDGIAYSLTSIDDMTIEVASKSGGYSGEVNIPETVTIDNNTFRVTAIGENAFKGCSNVTSVNIPSTVTEIKKNAFSGCTNLKLTIPSSVTSICEGGLDGVQEVKMVSSTPPSLSDMSDYTTTVVRVPVTSLEAYVGGKRWSNYKTLLGYGTAGTTFDYGGITYCMLTDDETCEVTKSSRDGYSYNPSTYSGDIVIPETVGGITVTQIGNFGEGYSYGAFYRATNVTSIRLPETITTIKDHAFQDCSGLTSINLPDGITKIGERAFSNCNKLESINLPKSLTSLGSYAFEELTSIKEITIPDEWTTVFASLCSEWTSLERINWGSNVQTIGEGAFTSCYALKSIELPSTVTKIDNEAFYTCSALKTISIPSSIESIGDCIFYKCSALEEITCYRPEPATIVGGAFSTLPSNVILRVPSKGLDAYKSAETWKSIPDIRAILEKDAEFVDDGLRYKIITDEPYTCTVIAPAEGTYSGDITIPETASADKIPVVQIDDKAFYASDITRITIPAWITSIGTSAFEGCNALTSAIISNAETTIGYNAFKNSALTEIALLAATPPTFLGDAFTGCYDATVLVPDGAVSTYQTAPGWSNFKTFKTNFATGSDFVSGGIHYRLLTELPYTCEVIALSDGLYKGDVTVPEQVDGYITVTQVGAKAFQNCTELTHANLPSTITKIGAYAFDGCTNLEEAIIPEAVTVIDTCAYQNCAKLTEITFPDALTEIKYFSFAGTSIETIRTNVYVKNPENAFNHYKYDHTITMWLPASLFQEYMYIRRDYTNWWRSGTKSGPISYKAIPGSKVSQDSFVYTALEDGQSFEVAEYTYKETTGNIEIKSTLTFTSQYSVTGIGENAFKDFTSMSSVTIPASITTIKDNAFAGCTALTSVTSLATEPATLAASAFSSYEGVTLNVPWSAGTAYAEAEGWKNFQTMKPTDAKVGTEFTAGSVRYRLTSTDPLTCEVIALGDEEKYTGEVTVPASLSVSGFDIAVTKVGDNAFSGCQSLTSVTLPEGITAIGKDAFASCKGLTTLPIPATVETIDEGAFINCEKAKNYTIPASVRSIGKDAFANIYPASVTVLAAEPIDITEDAFNGYTADWTIVTLYVPYGSKSAYAAATGWKNFAAISYAAGTQFEADGLCYEMTGANDCKVIAPYEGCTIDYAQLTEVNVPETVSDGISVTAIDKEVFKGLSLTKVSLPSTVTSIDESAFEDCAELTDVTIAAKASISAFAFKNSGLTSLKLLGSEVIDYDHVNGDVFLGVSDFSVYVPVGMKKAYKEKRYFDEAKLHYVENTFIADGVRYQVTGEDETTCSVIALSEGKYTDYVYIRNTVTNDELTVTAIGESAFKDCGELTSISLPETLQTIGSGAFAGCSSLTSITVPDGVTTIEENTFKNCSSLASVNLGSGLTNIKFWAFAFCTALKGITLPASVTSVDAYGFSSTGLERLTLLATTPPSLSSDPSFQGISLESITLCVPYAARTKYKTSEDCWKDFTTVRYIEAFDADGVTYVPNEDGKSVTLVTNYNGWTADVTIPASVTRTTTGDDNTEVQTTYAVTAISDEAFTNATALTSVTIPASVTTIATGAFSGCTALTSVTALSETPATLEADAFSAYTAELAVPEGALDTYKAAEVWKNFTNIFENITYFEVDNNGYNVLSRSEKTVEFKGYFSGWTYYTIPTTVSYKDVEYTVTAVGDNAFNGKRVIEITIPATVKSIGNSVFENGAYISSIYIHSESLEFVGENAFNCNSSCNLTIKMPNCTTPPVAKGVLASDEALANITLLVPYTTIDAYKNADYWGSINSINGCNSFTHNGLNYNILSYEDKTCEFARNSINGDLVIPSTAEYFGETMKVTAISGDACYGGNELESVTLPEGVTSIGDQAFFYCEALKTVTFPEGLTSIGEKAFFGCGALESIYLPNTVTKLGHQAFGRCEGVTDFHLSSSLTALNSGALYYMTSLKKIEIPETINSIESGVFEGASNLEKMYVLNTTPPTVEEESYINDLYAKTTLYVPSSALETYKSTSPWSNFENIVGFDQTFTENDMTFEVISPKEGTVKMVYNPLCEPKDYTDAIFEVPEIVTHDETDYTLTEIGKRAIMNAYAEIVLPKSITKIEEDFVMSAKKLSFLSPEPPTMVGCEDFAARKVYVPIGASEAYKNWALSFSNAGIEYLYEQYTLTVSAACGATLVLPWNSNIPEGVTAYSLDEVDDNGVIQTDEVNTGHGYLPANYPVLVMAKPGTYTFRSTQMDFEAEEEPNVECLIGSYEDGKIVPEDCYILTYKDGALAFRQSDGKTNTVNKYRAYLDPSRGGLDANAFTFLTIDFGGTTTDISSATSETDDEPVFDLSGRLITTPVKGRVYIKNGQKFIAK